MPAEVVRRQEDELARMDAEIRALPPWLEKRKTPQAAPETPARKA